MRVLHVVKKFPPAIGGDATAVAALARAQRRAGDEVAVVTHNTTDATEPVADRIGPRVAGADLDRLSWRRVRGLAAIRRWARDHLSSPRPDVVHAHGVDVGWAVSPIAETAGIPSVLTCHGVWFPVVGRRTVRGRAEIALLRRGRYRVITSVDAPSVASLHSVGFPRALLVPNGVDLDEFRGRTGGAGRFGFLFAGRHEEQKGLDVLLDACARLKRDGLAFSLDLAGSGQLTPRLRAQARSSGLEDIVRFLGAVPRADLLSAFRSADALVLPSRYEGFPLVILEAWAAGLAVVATRVGGIPDVCTADTAILVPPDDDDRLADAMAMIVKDRALREGLAARGHALAAERFSWDGIAVRYRDVYGKALAG